MFKEVLKLEGSEDTVNAEVQLLGWRLVKQLKRKYMVVNKIVPEGNGIKAMEGIFDFEGISEEVFDKKVKCDRKEEVDALEVDRVYNKYYAKYFNPNHETGDEEKNPSGVELDSQGDNNHGDNTSNNSGNPGSL